MRLSPLIFGTRALLRRRAYLALVAGLAVACAGAFAIGQVFGIVAVQLAAGLLVGHEAHRVGRAIVAEQRNAQALTQLIAVAKPRIPLPPFDAYCVSLDLAAYLFASVFARRPAVILEAGSGISTLVMALALERSGASGRIYSLESSPAHAARTRDLLTAHGVVERAQVIDAPLVAHSLGAATYRWYDFAGRIPARAIDFVFVDGPVSHSWRDRFPVIPLLRESLSPGALVIVDDGRRPEERQAIGRWRKLYPEIATTFLELNRGAWQLGVPSKTASIVDKTAA